MEVLQPREEKFFPNASIAALKGKVPWQLGAKEYHRVTYHTTNFTQEIFWGKYARGPLVGRKAAEN